MRMLIEYRGGGSEIKWEVGALMRIRNVGDDRNDRLVDGLVDVWEYFCVEVSRIILSKVWTLKESAKSYLMTIE
jgi:hypothetical protein